MKRIMDAPSKPTKTQSEPDHTDDWLFQTPTHFSALEETFFTPRGRLRTPRRRLLALLTSGLLMAPFWVLALAVPQEVKTTSTAEAALKAVVSAALDTHDPR